MEEMNLKAFLSSGNCSPEKPDDFIHWCQDMCLWYGDGPTKRHQIFKLWARLLWKQRTPYDHGTHFIWDDTLKAYLRKISGGPITNSKSPSGSVPVDARTFVQYVIMYIDDGY